MSRKGRGNQNAGQGAPSAGPDPGEQALLDQLETRMVLAAVAMHGMLAGKTALPQATADRSQDERRAEAAERIATDAVAIADALVNALSIPR